MDNNKKNTGNTPENRYERIAKILFSAALPHTITIKQEGFKPEELHAIGLRKVEVFAAVAMASIAYAIVSSQENRENNGTLRQDWQKQVSRDAVKIAKSLEEELLKFE